MKAKTYWVLTSIFWVLGFFGIFFPQLWLKFFTGWMIGWTFPIITQELIKSLKQKKESDK